MGRGRRRKDGWNDGAAAGGARAWKWRKDCHVLSGYRGEISGPELAIGVIFGLRSDLRWDYFAHFACPNNTVHFLFVLRCNWRTMDENVANQNQPEAELDAQKPAQYENEFAPHNLYLLKSF